MNTTKKLTLMSVAGAAALWAGCVNMEVWGIPLGPDGEQGMIADGVLIVDPAAQCVVACGGTFQMAGRLEVTAGATAGGNKYRAVVSVTNNLKDNAPTRTVQPGQAPYGSNGNSTLEIVGADVRYEYPTLTPDKRFLPGFQQRPADGMFFQEQTLATGALKGGSCMAVLVTVIDPEMARVLAQDPDIQAQLQNNGLVPITTHIRVNGRNITGARLATNELTYTIYLVRPGDLLNCASLSCPTGQTPTQAGCLSGQDHVECICA